MFVLEQNTFYRIAKDFIKSQVVKELDMFNDPLKYPDIEFFSEGNNYYNYPIEEVKDNKELYNKIILTGYAFNILKIIERKNFPDVLKLLVRLQDEYYITIGIKIIDYFYDNIKDEDENINLFIEEIIQNFFNEELKYI
jgi:hypothetical protein